MKIVRLSNRDELLELFKREIKEIRQQKPEGLMHIALAGGRSMGAAVGAILAQDPDTRNRMRFYLVDERLKGDKNKDTLLNEGLTDPIVIPELGKPLSKEPFDLVFLGIGEDGHFASLFPGTYTEDKTEEQVLLVEDSPKPPKRRTTLSPGDIATEKVKVLKSISPIEDFYMGRYESLDATSRRVVQTPTYSAFKLYVNSYDFVNIPIYILQTGRPLYCLEQDLP